MIWCRKCDQQMTLIMTTKIHLYYGEIAHNYYIYSMITTIECPPGWLSGELVRFMTWWSGRNFFPAYFHLSPLLKHVRKVVGGFGKKFV